MPSRRADGTLVFKIVVYGPSMSENIEVINWMIQEREGVNIKQLSMGQNILQSVDLPHGKNVVFQLITVTRQQRHKPNYLLKNIDGIIFTWDSLLDQWEKNIESLKELLRFYGDKLLRQISTVVLASKREQEDIVEISKIRQVLDTATLNHVLIYETIVDKGINIKRAFVYLVRQAVLNHYRKLKPVTAEEIPPKLSQINSTLDTTTEPAKKDVDTRPVRVLRGGQIEGGEYVFKIKVINNGKYNITDVNIYIHSYPEESLVLSRIDGHPEAPPDRAKFHKISKGGGFVSPSFIFKPSKDCIKGSIHSFINFINEEDQIKTINVEPHEIRMICGLLKPKVVSNEEFENLTKDLLTFKRNDKEFTIPCKAEELYQKFMGRK